MNLEQSNSKVAVSRKLDVLRTKIIKRQGKRDALVEVRDNELKWLSESQEEHRLAKAAQLFLLTEISERRGQAIEAIENLATAALTQVYGDSYKLVFNSFEEKRSAVGASNFRMDIKVVSNHEGLELKTGLLGERGGGVVEIVAFALRIAALNWKGYDGPLILDEAYKSLSNDDKLDAVARFLRQVTDDLGRQIIFATHKGDVFGQISDNVVQVRKIDGLADVKAIDTPIPSSFIENTGTAW